MQASCCSRYDKNTCRNACHVLQEKVWILRVLPSESLPLASLYKAAEMPRHRANHLCTLVYRLCSCSRRKVSSEQWLRLHLITSSVQKFCSEESVEISNGKVINKQQHCPVLEKIAFRSV